MRKILTLALLFVFIGSFLTVSAQGPQTGNWFHTASSGTQVVKGAAGFLESVTINGGSGGTVGIYDINGAGCSSTPASGLMANLASTSAPVTVFYSVRMLNGICVVLSANTDLTVSFN